MRLAKEPYQSDPLMLLVSRGSASLGAIAWVFIVLFPLAGIDTGHPWQKVIGINDFLFEAIWCIASYAVATFLVLLAKPIGSKFVPAWLVIALLGSLIFTLTLWPYSYWEYARSYNPNSPFPVQPPPPFDLWMLSALISSIYYFLFAGIFSFVASVMLKERNTDVELNLKQD